MIIYVIVCKIYIYILYYAYVCMCVRIDIYLDMCIGTNM